MTLSRGSRRRDDDDARGVYGASSGAASGACGGDLGARRRRATRLEASRKEETRGGRTGMLRKCAK